MSPQRPNVLFVLADDLGMGDVSCFNPQAGWKTKRMDELADQGMRFTDSHATSALCTPSRYSVLTGRYNWRSRLKRSVLPGDSLALIEKDRMTIPKLFQEQGYRTAVVGKWHLGLDWQLTQKSGSEPLDDEDSGLGQESAAPRMGRDGIFDANFATGSGGVDIDYTARISFGPNELGFDYSYITAASLDQPPYVYIENGYAQGVPDRIGGDHIRLDRRTIAHYQQIQSGPMIEGYDIDRVVPDFQHKALDILDGLLSQEEPWFFYVPSHLVHGPIVPNEPWKGSSGMGDYGDFVLQFDDYVGQLVDRIDAAGARENTIIIITSDNGVSGVAGLDELRSKGHDSSNGWRGRKSDIWEGGHREPFIVRWPARIPAGAVNPHLISHSDLFATFAEILGVPLSDSAAEDSISSLPLWCGHDQAVREELVSHSGGGGFAVRRGQWKLNFVTNGDGMDDHFAANHGGVATEYVPFGLYNLAEDPKEQHNVFSQHPEIVNELGTLLTEHIRRGRSTPGPASTNEPNHPTGQWRQIQWIESFGVALEDVQGPTSTVSVST